MSKEWGLLRTKRTKEDERKKTIAITENGRKLLEQRTAVRKAMFQAIIRCWQPFEKEDCERMTRLFENGLRQADVVLSDGTKA